MQIREEQGAERAKINDIIEQAFAAITYSDGSEGAIVEALHAARAVSLSLVAEDDGEIAGHIVFSPVTIGGADCGWVGLGPLSVHPSRQGLGIGSALTREGLERVRASGAAGCVVLGDPDFYTRFGFEQMPTLTFEGAPSEYFLALPFGSEVPLGAVRYHSAFDVATHG